MPFSIILKDHDTVKDLFDRFEKAESAGEKEKTIELPLTELKMHAVIEEVFYPTVRKHAGDDVMNEADEEHQMARVLIAELDATGRGNDLRDAKFTVLAESVRHHIKEHHIKEEENERLPKAKGIAIDFEALGKQMLDRKEELQEDGIPSDAEHAMVGRHMAARIRPQPLLAGRRSRAKNGRARTAH